MQLQSGDTFPIAVVHPLCSAHIASICLSVHDRFCLLRAASFAIESDLKVGTGAAEFAATDEMTIAGGIGGGKVVGQEGQLRLSPS